MVQSVGPELRLLMTKGSVLGKSFTNSIPISIPTTGTNIYCKWNSC